MPPDRVHVFAWLQAVWEADQPARAVDAVGPEHTFMLPWDAPAGSVYKLSSETYAFMHGRVEVWPAASQALDGQGMLAASTSSVCSALPAAHERVSEGVAFMQADRQGSISHGGVHRLLFYYSKQVAIERHTFCNLHSVSIQSVSIPNSPHKYS